MQFFAGQGLRPIGEGADFAVLELRGGTHLLLMRTRQRIKPRTEAPFDLMVDDIAGAHARWSEQGFTVSPITHARSHEQFWLSDPDGNRVLVNSSHVMGVV